MHLTDNHSLGSVHDERTSRRHQWKFAQINILLFDITDVLDVRAVIFFPMMTSVPLWPDRHQSLLGFCNPQHCISDHLTVMNVFEVEEPPKSEIGKTERNTASSPSSLRWSGGTSLWRNRSYESGVSSVNVELKRGLDMTKWMSDAMSVGYGRAYGLIDSRLTIDNIHEHRQDL